MKTPKRFLCKKCLEKMQEYDAQRKKVWRIRVKEVKSRSQKVNVKIK